MSPKSTETVVGIAGCSVMENIGKGGSTKVDEEKESLEVHGDDDRTLGEERGQYKSSLLALPSRIPRFHSSI